MSDNSVKQLRNTDTDLKLPLLKPSIGQRWFSYRGARLWNKLGAVVKTAQTLHQFKAAYKANSNI